MALRKLVRESTFQIARRDVAYFLQDHEEELLSIFREEMQRLDDELPEERLFIDLKMVPLGEAVMKATVRALTRFLLEATPPATTGRVAIKKSDADPLEPTK